MTWFENVRISKVSLWMDKATHKTLKKLCYFQLLALDGNNLVDDWNLMVTNVGLDFLSRIASFFVLDQVR